MGRAHVGAMKPAQIKEPRLRAGLTHTRSENSTMTNDRLVEIAKQYVKIWGNRAARIKLEIQDDSEIRNDDDRWTVYRYVCELCAEAVGAEYAFSPFETGGGCTALYAECFQTRVYALVTHGDDASYSEDPTAPNWCAGIYDMDTGDEIVPMICGGVTLRAALRRANRALEAISSPSLIAREFVRLMQDALTEDQLILIDGRNATDEYASACASHDFLDANMLMLDALTRAGADGDPEGEWFTCMVNAAWEIARNDGFSRQTRLQCLDEEARAFMDAPSFTHLNARHCSLDEWLFEYGDKLPLWARQEGWRLVRQCEHDPLANNR
jgi:hypothetical protein